MSPVPPVGRIKTVPERERSEKGGGQVPLFHGDSSSVIPVIMDYAKAGNTKVLSITTFGPSLEDVFIKLTGAWSPDKRGEHR